MTKENIISMAREAGLPLAWISDSGVLTWAELERFAALVAAAEREACAKVCDEYATNSRNPMNFAENCAAAIRARSNT